MKKKIKSFLSSELTNKEANQEYAKFHIIPIPLEKTVTYGKGTRNGPLAILNASNQLERLSQTTEPIKKGIAKPIHIKVFLKNGFIIDCFGPSSIIDKGTWTNGKAKRSRTIH